ncbi:MAG TPA: cation-translocating P-type ATPase [Clostridia bacterium]|nr:cation-translocating P-type ATPase [Clostridia bacterium]
MVGEVVDAAVIGAIVIIQAVVEAAQSCRAEKALDKLKGLSDPHTTVLREGKITRIPSRELVPGDILHLSAGDMVPADAKIIEASNLLTNEACLTGESIPVAKDNRKSDLLRIPVADRANMLFSGTGIIGGRVTAVVIATGMQTELGRIAQLLGDVKSGRTNLQKQLDYLGKRITQLVAISVGTITVIYLLRGRSVWEVLRAGISLAVGAVPEGLPAVLTVALTTGVQRMVKRNAIVRNISAVETLGSTTVICADKTGTLTKNEMTVKELYADNTHYEVTGDGYRPDGEIKRKGQDGRIMIPAPVAKTLKASVLCSNAELRLDSKGKWSIIGDPTEGALLTAAAKADLWWQDLKNEFQRQREIAFDTDRRMMTVVCREPDGDFTVYVKGAPDSVINYCTSAAGSGQEKVLDLETRNRILKANDKMARQALRVLAVAHKRLPPDADLNKADLENNLTFCGLVGMSDSPREGVREAIRKCHAAGIKVIMITGDHQKTAEAVAEKLGILGRGKSITGRELEDISDDEFAKQALSIAVYSRTTPDQKLRIVRALKNHGQIVAMTGDGVNDAPAVKEANVGIAMGLTGTDVTREVAGITLSDDNFVTIVNGIEEGRTVGMNLAKSVRYILSGSFGQLLVVFTSAALGFPTPLLPSQILWVNLVTESLPAMSLTADPPEKDYMNRPPFNPGRRFVHSKSRDILRKGVLFGLGTFGLFASGLTWWGWTLNKARTMAFSQLVVNRVFNLIGGRKTKNPLIFPAAAMTVSTLAATMYLPFMNPIFSTVPLALKDWLLLTANAYIAGKVDAFLGRERPGKNTLIGGQHEQGHTTKC